MAPNEVKETCACIPYNKPRSCCTVNSGAQKASPLQAPSIQTQAELQIYRKSSWKKSQRKADSPTFSHLNEASHDAWIKVTP